MAPEDPLPPRGRTGNLKSYILTKLPLMQPLYASHTMAGLMVNLNSHIQPQLCSGQPFSLQDHGDL